MVSFSILKSAVCRVPSNAVTIWCDAYHPNLERPAPIAPDATPSAANERTPPPPVGMQIGDHDAVMSSSERRQGEREDDACDRNTHTHSFFTPPGIVNTHFCCYAACRPRRSTTAPIVPWWTGGVKTKIVCDGQAREREKRKGFV